KLRAVVHRPQIHSEGQISQARNEQHPTNHPEYREDLQRRVDSGSREVYVSASSRNQDLRQPHRIFSSQALTSYRWARARTLVSSLGSLLQGTIHFLKA